MSNDTNTKRVLKTLKDLSNQEKLLSYNDIRVVFALERAIARIENEPVLGDHLIFKGGFVLFRTQGSPRFTRDADALAEGISKSVIRSKIKENILKDLGDGIHFCDVKIDEFGKGTSYPGLRFNFGFQIGELPKENRKLSKLSRIHIDVGFGDRVVNTSKQSLEPLLSFFDPISWRVYPPEFILAEKIHTLILKGSANSRAKDVYDIVFLFDKCCDRKNLLSALKLTFETRQTRLPVSFQKEVEEFDIQFFEQSWKSVELLDENATFQEYWQRIIAIMKEIDS